MKETKESVNKLNENVSKMKKQVKKFNMKKKSTEIHEEQFHDVIATFSEGIMACIEEKLGQSVPDKSSRKYPFQPQKETASNRTCSQPKETSSAETQVNKMQYPTEKKQTKQHDNDPSERKKNSDREYASSASGNKPTWGKSIKNYYNN